MNRFLYSLILYLAVPFILLRLVFRAVRAPAYLRRWPERFGFFTLPTRFARSASTIWIHSVSVGETLAAVPLVKHLQQRRPGQQILLTTMTPTGSVRARELLGEKIFHVYLPYDLPGAMQRFLRNSRPDLLVVMETELWPNLFHYCHRNNVKVLLANARLSEKSAAGYARIRKLTAGLLQTIDLIAAQGEDDARRLIQLGADPARTRVSGSLKFDVEVPDLERLELPPLFRQIRASARPVWIAASTREGEEQKVLQAFEQCLRQQPTLLLVLVPRHPERFNAVASLCEQQHLKMLRRSTAAQLDAVCQVFLGDSMGEMWFYYALADIAFVGGSLVNTGCHNVLEPAALGLPIVTGPSQFNFAAICQQLEAAGALKTVQDEQELAEEITQLLRNDQWRTAMGTAGKYVVEQNRGSLLRLSAMIDELLPPL